jgi:hypothetical protein
VATDEIVSERTIGHSRAALLMFDTRKILIWPSEPQAASFDEAPAVEDRRELRECKAVRRGRTADRRTQCRLPASDRHSRVPDFASPRLEAQVEFSATILGHGGKIVGTRTFRDTVPLDTVDASAVAAAFDQAFGKAIVGLVVCASPLVY